MKSLFNKYENIKIFAGEKYRNFSLETSNNDTIFSNPEISEKEFIRKMQDKEYIIIKGTDEKKNKKMFLLLINPNSKTMTQTVHINKIFNKIDREPCDLYIFTKDGISSYIKKNLKKMHGNITYKNYFYKHFILEINKAPLCGKCEILSKEEEKKLFENDIKRSKFNLPRICDSDPQIIWIGGEWGQIVRIKSISIVSGIKLDYRIIVPKVDL